MVTPLVMLMLMTGPYLVARYLPGIPPRNADYRSAAAIGAGMLFVFTGIGHFVQTGPMSEMLPPWVPARVALVYLTGLLELAIALGFFMRKTRHFTGWVAAVVLVLFFPANIYAALNHVPMGGHAWGPVYLLVRAPLQLAILFWIFWFVIRREPSRVVAAP